MLSRDELFKITKLTEVLTTTTQSSSWHIAFAVAKKENQNSSSLKFAHFVCEKQIVISLSRHLVSILYKFDISCGNIREIKVPQQYSHADTDDLILPPGYTNIEK